jgi:hypothetical protein
MRAGKFDFGARLVFPTGIYVVASTIDLTGVHFMNLVIDGQGAVIVGRCPGQPIIDALGSRFITMRDLTIVGDKEAPPKLGMQIGRLKDGRVADDHYFVNVKFMGHFTLSCLLNNASEPCGFDHVYFWNGLSDTDSFCLIQDGLSYFDATSQFAKPARIATIRDNSFNENEFINCTFQHGGGGTPVWLGDTSRHRFYRCFAAGDGQGCSTLNT